MANRQYANVILQDTDTDPDCVGQCDTLTFDRRSHSRSPATGSCTAVVIDDGRTCITGVDIVDMSEGGLGLRSRVEMSPGAICHLHPRGMMVLGEVGRVVRCARDGDDYRVGLVAARRMAA